MRSERRRWIPLDLPAPAEQSFSEYAARQNEDTGKLLARSAICWVAVIALIVLLALSRLPVRLRAPNAPARFFVLP